MLEIERAGTVWRTVFGKTVNLSQYRLCDDDKKLTPNVLLLFCLWGQKVANINNTGKIS